MSLPVQVIDRLFSRLAATYGATWDRSLGQAPIGDVKTAWSHELSGFRDRLDDVAWALENLPEKCPNVIEFRNLVRRAPTPDLPRLPEPKADPARGAAELRRLAPILERKDEKPGKTDWAHRIVQKAESGIPVAPAVLRMAREVTARYPA